MKHFCTKSPTLTSGRYILASQWRWGTWYPSVPWSKPPLLMWCRVADLSWRWPDYLLEDTIVEGHCKAEEVSFSGLVCPSEFRISRQQSGVQKDCSFCCCRGKNLSLEGDLGVHEGWPLQDSGKPSDDSRRRNRGFSAGEEDCLPQLGILLGSNMLRNLWSWQTLPLWSMQSFKTKGCKCCWAVIVDTSLQCCNTLL